MASGCDTANFEPEEPLLMQTHEATNVTFLVNENGTPSSIIIEAIDPEQSPEAEVTSGYVIEIFVRISSAIRQQRAFVRGSPVELEERGRSQTRSIAGSVDYTIQANPDRDATFIIKNNRRSVDAIRLVSNGLIPVETNIEGFASRAIFAIDSRFEFDNWVGAEFEVSSTSGSISN